MILSRFLTRARIRHHFYSRAVQIVSDVFAAQVGYIAGPRKSYMSRIRSIGLQAPKSTNSGTHRHCLESLLLNNKLQPNWPAAVLSNLFLSYYDNTGEGHARQADNEVQLN
jgi:hypothetical protein